ncbi:MAG: hypothetical protein IKI72_09665 [Bacteroidales bacterium]|nr:hypothetical protein [Bacteroidales bacterium]
MPAPPAGTALFFFAAWIYMAVYWGDLLYRMQASSLFLTDGGFLSDMLHRPAGPLRYAGSFLTACCFRPVLGAGLFAGCLTLTALIAGRLFRPARAWSWLIFAPAAAVIWLQPAVNYAIYRFFDTTLLFSLPLGLTAMMLLYALMARLLRGRLAGLLPVVAVAGYFMIGSLFFGTILLLIVHSFRERHRTGLCLGCAVLTTLLPFAAYRFVFSDALAVCYTAPMPLRTAYPLLFADSLLPVGLILLLAILPSGKQDRRHANLYALAGLAVLLTVTGATAYRDANFRTELRAYRLLERHDFEGLRSTTKGLTQPTHALLACKAIAADYTGRLTGDFFDGFGLPVPPRTHHAVTETDAFNKEFSLYSGLVNNCYHWAMEDMAYERPTLQLLQLLSQCALLNREYPLARKYAGVFRRTLFHRSWAQRLERWADAPESFFADKVYGRIAEAMPREDMLANNNLTPTVYYLMLQQGTATELSRSLTAALYLNRPDLFLPAVQWAEHFTDPVRSKHLQEAVAIFDLTDSTDLSQSLKVDAQISARAKDFLKAWQTMPEQQDALRRQFGDTYYYYLFTINR